MIYQCIRPACPPSCDMCNHAVPQADAMLKNQEAARTVQRTLDASILFDMPLPEVRELAWDDLMPFEQAMFTDDASPEIVLVPREST